MASNCHGTGEFAAIKFLNGNLVGNHNFRNPKRPDLPFKEALRSAEF
jgi:hypothetical protein